MAAPEFAIVGRVRKAHGIRGELVVESLTDTPDATFASGRRVFAGTVTGELSPDRRELTVGSSRPFKGGWIVAFESIQDRNDAECWRERYLLVPSSELAPPREGEVFLHELLGLRVELPSGERLGDVVSTYELPQGLVLDVALPSGSVLLPYRSDVILRVDLENGVLVAEPPPGLMD